MFDQRMTGLRSSSESSPASAAAVKISSERTRTDSDADARGRLEAAVSSLTPVDIGLHKTVFNRDAPEGEPRGVYYVNFNDRAFTRIST